MFRSLTRVLVVVLTALPFAPRTYAADSAASAIVGSYGILALDELRTRGFTNLTSNVGVNVGSLYSHSALRVANGTVAASSVRLGDGSVCMKLVADTVIKAAGGCGPLPSMSLGGSILGETSPAEACGFPNPFSACSGPSVTVGHGATQTLPPGTYGAVLVQGGGAGAGTLILNGGHYVFCNDLRVSRNARLLVKTATEIDVGGEMSFSNLSTVGPAPGSGLAPRDLKIFVNGPRLRFSRKSAVTAKLCAPNGALFINDGARLTGCALAKRIRADHMTVQGTCVLPPSSTTTTVPPTTTTTITPVTTSTIGTTSTSTSSTSTSTTEVGASTTTTSTSTTGPLCGNGTVDPGEDCDGNVSGDIVCLDSANGAVLEAQCPLCTTGENGCKLDCTCCPSGHCGTTSSTTTSTIAPNSTSSTITPITTTSSTLSPSTTTTSSSTSSTSSTLGPTTSTTSSTAPIPTTSTTSTSTTSTAPIPTTSTSAPSTSSTSIVTTSTSTSSPPTTIAPSTTTTTVPGLAFTIGTGSSNCGSAGFGTPASAPLSGQILDGTNTKIADLGLGCLYFGGGKGTNVPGGIIPTGSTTFFGIASQNGNAITIGGAAGPPTGCTKGAGPAKHCVKGEPGTDTHGACASDLDCQNHGGSCVLDANCFFGPPLSIPNPSLAGTSTCVINVIQNDISGTGDLAVGSANLTMTLASRVYLTGTSYDDPTTTTVIEACPRCLAGVCNKGANQGKACATTAPNFLSLDCPPQGTQFLATLPIALNPFTTGTSTITNPTGVFCPGQVTSPSSSQNVGALGKPTGRTVKETGFVAGNLNDHAQHNAALGASFCIPATGNALIDPIAGLPGPGALSVTGKLVLQ